MRRPRFLAALRRPSRRHHGSEGPSSSALAEIDDALLDVVDPDVLARQVAAGVQRILETASAASGEEGSQQRS